MNLRSWLRRTAETPRPAPSRAAGAHPGEVEAAAVFVCSTCGRTNLPEAGDWDPPICQECDAAINEDAILESEEGALDDL